jgi:LmbE family N-acetylglucosaminyl deacetylase
MILKIRERHKKEESHKKNVVIIVAHPDDETLWAGGTILSHPHWSCFVVCLCRSDDKDRAPKFYKALEIMRAEGIMGNLDDSPEQKPLADEEVERAILNLLPARHYDLVITHNPTGEYTKHLRHEETSKAVLSLWQSGKISTTELWTFAYEDGNREYLPRPVENANICRKLTKHIWLRKYSIITETYGFSPDSWEAKTTPRTEAFWHFSESYLAKEWLVQSKNSLL